jgi:2-polyprenyl-6-methoxyphenol hydroxylase-like FAD-dependent oxidoreductase
MSDDVISRAPIAIVGGGPVGLVLALHLDRYGVKSVVFNTEENSRWHPKGNTHNARTMEHYRRLGISRDIRALGLPFDHPTDAAYFTRLNGWELARLRMPSEKERMEIVAASHSTHQEIEPLHRANQMYVEKFLLDHAATRPNITLRFGWRVQRFAQDETGVSLEASRLGDGAAEHWRAQYLVGCDGGQSTVRRGLGIHYEGFDALQQVFFGGSMVASYVRAPTLYPLYLGHRRAWNYWVVNPELRTVVVSLDGAAEFLLITRREHPDQRIDDETVTQTMQRCAGAEIPVEMLGHRPWTAGVALVAEKFAERRVILAGDSIHLFTPSGGFGMNTGLDDTANLAWKLWAIIQGWGGAGLLASFETERKPVAHRNTVAGRELAKQIGAVPAPVKMEEDSPEGAAAREEVRPFLNTFGDEFASIGVQLGARYDGSPLVVADGAPPADNYVEYSPSGVPGGRAPQIWLDRGRGIGSSLFDRLGLGFTLLRLGKAPKEAAPIQAAAKSRGVPLAILDVALPEARELYGRDLVLIRPDQHIAWRGDRAPADAERLFRQIIGA